jgi:hypothetical protein
MSHSDEHQLAKPEHLVKRGFLTVSRDDFDMAQ